VTVATALGTLPQDALQISLSMQYRDNLKGNRFRTVNDGVVGIASQRPKTERATRDVRAELAAVGSFGQEHTRVVNCLFHAVSNAHIVVCDVGPDLKNVTLGEGSKSVNAHRLVECS
jgi:hypothetical protein